jgi:2-dehydro-3-deoxyphosphogluconate aldolase/(4S)-4-hydroxy-2-oxoglutarate aldolase
MQADLKTILKYKILPAVVFYDEEHVLPVAEAFLNAGLNVMEIPVRTFIAFDAINAVRKKFPEMFVGAGTLLTTGSISDAINAGAQFGLSSSLNTKVCNEATAKKFPFIPGVMTPSEIEHAYDLGYSIQKIFPAAQLGGKNFLKAMLGPYEQLDLQFIPMGGVNISNMHEYLQLKNVIALGGTWLASKELLSANNFTAVYNNAIEAMKIVKEHNNEN